MKQEVTGWKKVWGSVSKGKVHPRTGHECPRDGLEVWLYSFFNFSTRWRWVVNATLWPLYPWERDPSTHWAGSWVGWSGQLWKILPPLGFDSWTVHPVVSCYTEYAILAHFGALTALLMKITVFWDVTILL
jgi:hypothetical protein